MNRKIAIIGATGKVGSAVVRHLLGKGHSLRLVARNADNLKHFGKDAGVTLHSGSAADADFLEKVLEGADAALLMIPGDFTSQNIGASQDAIGKAETEAVRKSGIRHVLNLSSVGGHTEEKTGIVAGLARQERRLNELETTNVLHLRPSYFMENFLANIGMIKSMNIHGSPLRPDASFPIIAVRDIAKVAALKLEEPSWKGKTVLPLLGPRDYTMREVTSALGKAIGKPDLPYVQFPYDQARQALVDMGLTRSIADAFVELNRGINEGVFNLEKRSRESTTPTTIEEFALIFAEAFAAG